MSSSTSSAPAVTTSRRTVRIVLALVSVIGFEFMLQLDATIVTVALPAIQTEFDVSTSALSWVLNGFGIAFGGLLLLGGRLGDVAGHRRMFVLGAAVFAVASGLAALAPTFEWVVVGRVLQGVGGAFAGPAGLALLRTSLDEKHHSQAFALYSTVTGLGASAGLVLGGILTSLGGWRWTLLVNVPVAVLVIVLALSTLPRREDHRHRVRLDAPGAALSVLALGTLIFGLVRVAEFGWADPIAVWALVGSILLLIAFFLVERRTSDALVPLRILTGNRRGPAFIGLVLMAFTLNGFLFFSTQFLQRTLGMGPLATGVAFLPFTVMLLAAAHLAGRWAPRVGALRLAAIGFAAMAVGGGWLTLLDEGSQFASGFLPGAILLGVGAGLAVVPLNVSVLTTVEPKDTGTAAGTSQLALAAGGALGIAVLLSLYGEPQSAAAVADATARTFVASALAAAAAAAVAWFASLSKPQHREG